MNKPLAIAFGVIEKDEAVFITRDGECRFNKYTTEVINILNYCNGLRSVEEISEESNLDINIVKDLLESLETFKIVTDSSNLYKTFFDDMQYESQFKNALNPSLIPNLMGKVAAAHSNKDISGSNFSNFEKLLYKRRSTRAFKNTGSFTEQRMFKLLSNMYYKNNRCLVPSAGSIYPLDFYIIILSQIGRYCPGVYEYSPLNNDLSLKRDQLSIDHLKYIFGQKDIFSNAHLIICISADISKESNKYGNRGLAYTYIEVGHVGQNIQLLTADDGLGNLEVGGYLGGHLDDFIGLIDDQHVLLPVIIGEPDESVRDAVYEKWLDSSTKLWKLMDKYVGEDKIINWIDAEELSDDEYYMPRVSCLASFESVVDKKTGQKGFSFATGYSTIEAATKAIAEAVERTACGEVRIDYRGSLNLISNSVETLEPLEIYDISSGWYKRESIRDRYEKFNENSIYEWVQGRRISTNKKTAILVDQVFYPISQGKIKRKLIYNVSSSGTAAHFNYELALQSAVLELIERDALAVLWYGKPKTYEIQYKDLPEEIKIRVEHWKEKKGCELRFLLISVDSMPVVLCVMRRKKYPYFVVGASSSPNINSAMIKAWDELEATLLSWMKERLNSVEMEEIESPHNHGIYHANIRNNETVQWLFEDKFSYWDGKLGSVCEWKEVCKKFDIYEVIIKEPKDKKNDLWVIRALSPVLLTLNFGYGNEPNISKRFGALQLNRRWTNYPAPPHFFP